MARLGLVWAAVRDSLWFLPALGVAAAVLLAIGLIELDAATAVDYAERMPRLFGAGAEGSRSMLEAVAGSVITIAGVAFSITVVALSLAAQQYSSRVLRQFMRDRASQAVLGVLAGVFAYCLVVLRTIRGGDDDWVPSLAVLGGVVLAFVALGAFIFFIHHIALSIQASEILATVSHDTFRAIDHLFPERMGEGMPAGPEGDDPMLDWQPVAAPSAGVIEAVDADAMLAYARRHDVVVRMEHGVGSFVVEGLPIASVGRPDGGAPPHPGALRKCFSIGRQRTVEQDAGYGVRQLVDVALKALSPGINDTTTAISAIDWLTAVMARLAARGDAPRRREEDGALRVLALGPNYEGLLAEAFEQIRESSAGNVAVLARLLDALETLERVTTGEARRDALADQVERVRDAAGRHVEAGHARGPLDDRATGLLRRVRRSVRAPRSGTAATGARR